MYPLLRVSGSPVALNASQEAPGALVLALVERGRLGRNRREGDHTRVLLVEVAVNDFARDGEVLDRGPDRPRTNLPELEVGVAGRTNHQQRNNVAADQTLGRAVVASSSP